MECNVVIHLFANTIIKGTPASARKKIEKLLKETSSFKIKGVEFVNDGGEITGVFDENWDEIQEGK